MFYCKDVKYDMCELKKNHKKNKICKEFDDLTFHWSHSVSLNVSFLPLGSDTTQRESGNKDIFGKEDLPSFLPQFILISDVCLMLVLLLVCCTS